MTALTNIYRYRKLPFPYGCPFVCTDLANRTIGAGWNYTVYRFRAPTTSSLTTFHAYYATTTDGDPGYGHGTLGIINVVVRADDGTSNHWPNMTSGGLLSGTLIATQTGASPASDPSYQLQNRFFSMTFSPGVPLVSNRIYHLVFTNTDPTPGTALGNGNYCSNDCMTNPFGSVGAVLPTLYGAPVDLPHWSYLSSSDGGSTFVNPCWITPILEMHFTSGEIFGGGWMEGSQTSKYRNVTGAAMVRENFTPSATRTVAFARVALDTTNGTGTPVCRLETGSGTLIESGNMTIESSTYAGGDTTTQPWRLNFATPHVLTSGTTYHLQISAASGGLRTGALVKGSLGGRGFDTSVCFPDGWAEFSTNSGSTWTQWDATHASDLAGFMLGSPGEQ